MYCTTHLLAQIHSLSWALYVGIEDSAANPALSVVGRAGVGGEPKLQTLKWMAYRRDTWAVLCTAALEEL